MRQLHLKHIFSTLQCSKKKKKKRKTSVSMLKSLSNCQYISAQTLQHLLWAVLLRAPLLLCVPQAGFLGVGCGGFWGVRFLPAVCGLGHRLAPATTATLQCPHPTTTTTTTYCVLTAERCYLLQRTMQQPPTQTVTIDKICLTNLTLAFCYFYCPNSQTPSCIYVCVRVCVW